VYSRLPPGGDIDGPQAACPRNSATSLPPAWGRGGASTRFRTESPGQRIRAGGAARSLGGVLGGWCKHRGGFRNQPVPRSCRTPRAIQSRLRWIASIYTAVGRLLRLGVGGLFHQSGIGVEKPGCSPKRAASRSSVVGFPIALRSMTYPVMRARIAGRGTPSSANLRMRRSIDRRITCAVQPTFPYWDHVRRIRGRGCCDPCCI